MVSEEYAGLLDDRTTFTTLPYTWEIVEDSPTVSAVEFSTYSDIIKLEINKTIKLYKERPLIEVRYRYVNKSPARPAQMIRNFFRVGGEIASSDHHCFLPMNTGVVEKPFLLRDEHGRKDVW